MDRNSISAEEAAEAFIFSFYFFKPFNVQATGRI